jgi:membrane protease YdiL (CAAX protease family)
VYSILFISFVVTWVLLLNKGSSYAFIDYPMPLLIVGLIHSCIGAPVVEEILFRGYWYAQSEKVWDKDGWYINWDGIEFNIKTKQKESRRIMRFEITYAAIFSSLLFGIWHLNVIQAIYTFFGGLFFVKTKREWGDTLIAPMILHATWNFMAQIFVITNLPILTNFLTWLISYI